MWCAALASIGYSLGSSWHHVVKDFDYAGYVAIALVVIAIGAVIAHRVLAVRGERARNAAPEGPIQAGEDSRVR
jgi:membrane protein DedA with SNARE-associated domain